MTNSRACSQRPITQTGFTLIELVVVLALIVLLIGITYPLLERWTEGALRQAGRQLTAVIERLYERAVVTRQIYRLRMDIGTERYQPEVLQVVDGERVFVPLPEHDALPAGVQFHDLVTSQQVKIVDGEAALYFYPIGRMDTVIIHLEQRSGLQSEGVLSLAPHPLTGRVVVSSGDFEFESAGSGSIGGIMEMGGMGTVQKTVTSPPQASNRTRAGAR